MQVVEEKDELSLHAADYSSAFKPWLAEFKSNGEEARFRSWSFAEDRLLLGVLIKIGIAGMALFILNDFRMSDSLDFFYPTIGIRMVGLAIFLMIAMLYDKLDNIDKFDRANLGLLVTLVILVVATDAMRPVDFITHIGVDVTIIYLCFIAYTGSLRLRFLLAITCSTGYLLVLFLIKQPNYSGTYASYTVSIVLSNFLGYWIAMRYGRSRRSAYLSLLGEMKAREEIKTLKGILPICSYCKNIRDDEGSWEQLEAYIHHHSDAVFSHGICPGCKRKHFPEHA